jgi:hypothetical protein
LDFVPFYRAILIDFLAGELTGTFVPTPDYFCTPRDALAALMSNRK